MTRNNNFLILVCLAMVMAVPATADTIADVKLKSDGAQISLTEKLVTFTAETFVYIQEDDRSSGILILRSNHGLTTGMRVSLSGRIYTSQEGERLLVATTLTQSGQGAFQPLVLANREVGGKDWHFNPANGAGQRGVPGAEGLNNIGLYIRTTGVVTFRDSLGAFIYIDDGSARDDGNTLGPDDTGVKGLRVTVPEGTNAADLGEQVLCTGVSSLTLVNNERAPVLRAKTIGGIVPIEALSEMVFVPAGSFLMGNTGTGWDAYYGFDREYPQHWIYVPGYWLGKYEVTRGQYRKFIEAGGYNNPLLWSDEGWNWRVDNQREEPLFWDEEVQLGGFLSQPPGILLQTENHPVVGISYYEAEAFARWTGARLPTEAEWEKAARWDGQPRVYPWGNVREIENSNNWYDTLYVGFQTAPVGSYPAGVSPYGCYDMSGNVWEWTSNWYKSYPGNPHPFDRTGEQRTLRGGSWYGVYGARAASRLPLSPDTGNSDTGFRIAR